MTPQNITGLVLAVMAALAWALVCLVGHGYSNSVDSIALWLHRHATDCRKRHARRTAAVNEQWVRQLETNGQGQSQGQPAGSGIELSETNLEAIIQTPLTLQSGKYRHF